MLRQNIINVKVSHADLGKPRIKRDETDVACLVDLIDNNWTNPFGSDTSDLVSTSARAVATPEVSSGLLTARKKGEEAQTVFQEQWLQRGEGFYDKRERASMTRSRSSR